MTLHKNGLVVGSSPHTRGAPLPLLVSFSVNRIIPAYAGSTATSPGPGCRGRDHPRIRGEHAPVPPGICSGDGSSPHTRGARGGLLLRSGGRRIIPAYAGST